MTIRVVLQWQAGLVSGEQEVMGQSPAGEPSSQWEFAGTATDLKRLRRAFCHPHRIHLCGMDDDSS